MAENSTVQVFLERAGVHETSGVADLFRAVRQIPYGVTGDRTARKVVENWCGSCSGKHILLSTLFDYFGFRSRIVTVETTVDRGIPEDPRISTRIRELAKANVIPDFHHFSQIFLDSRWVDIDATWDDELEDIGFPVNVSWDGVSNTRLAFAPIRVVACSSAIDLPVLKMRLLEGLTASQYENRQEFFRELTLWLIEQVRTDSRTSTSGLLAARRKKASVGGRKG